MKKKLFLITIIALCFNFQFAYAQSINFVFTITNASSLINPNGQINVQCTNSPAPLTYELYGEGAFLIGTGTSISGLYPYNYYQMLIYSSFCQFYGFGVYIDSYSNDTYLLDVTLNISNTSAPASVIINNYTKVGAPYHIMLDNEEHGITYSDTTVNSASNVTYNNLTSDYTIYRLAFQDYMTYITGGFGGLVFSFNTKYDATGNSCTGIQTQVETIDNKIEFTVYPNPSNGIFTVNNRSKEITSIKIVDSFGKIVYLNESVLSSENKTVDISNFAKGVYSMTVISNKGVSNKKIFIQ